MKYNPYDENMVVLGMAGSGKTTYVQYLLYNLMKSGVNYIVWDYNWQYPSILGAIQYYDANKVIKLKSFNIIRPIDKTAQALDYFLSDYLTYNTLFILEEAHEYTTKFSFLSREFERIVRTGRNFGNCYIAVSQRPADLHNSILSNAHHIIAFKLLLPRDIDFLVRWIGEEARDLKDLPQYHYLYKKYGKEAVLMKPITPIKVF